MQALSSWADRILALEEEALYKPGVCENTKELCECDRHQLYYIGLIPPQTWREAQALNWSQQFRGLA